MTAHRPMTVYRYAAIDIRTDRILAMSDSEAGVYPEVAREWAELCERQGSEWVSIDGLQRHPDGTWRGGYRCAVRDGGAR